MTFRDLDSRFLLLLAQDDLSCSFRHALLSLTFSSHSITELFPPHCTSSLFMQAHDFFIPTQTPRSSGLLTQSRWCQWGRVQRKPFSQIIRRRCWLEETALLGCLLLQRFLFPFKEPLECFVKVEQQMEPIGHLLGLGCSFASTLCIGSCTVTANHFNSRMSSEPGFQCLSLPVWQDLHNAMSLQIDQERAVGLPFAERPIVYPKHAWRRSSRKRSTAQQTEHGVSTDGHQDVFALTRRRSASQFFGDATESAGLSIGATSMGHYEIGKRLGKGFTSTSRIRAEKSTHLDTESNGIVHQRHVRQSARIPTVNLCRDFRTVRTRNGLLRRTNRQEEGLAFTGDLLKQQVRARRKHQGGYG